MPTDHPPMQETFENSLMHRWLTKPVYASRLVCDLHQQPLWRLEGIAQVHYCPGAGLEGGPTLRFSTTLRDEAYLRQDVAQHGTFSGESGGGTSAILPFDPPQDWSAYNRIAVWVYLHPMKIQRVSLNLQLEPNFRPPLPPYDFISFPRPTFHAQHLVPGQWNTVLWEIANYPRQAITGFVLSQELYGFEPGTSGVVTYDIGRIELQRVDADRFEGWQVETGRIAFNHVGYRPEGSKLALASDLDASHFQVVEAASGAPAFTSAVRQVVTEQGRFQVLDFTDFHTPGQYLLSAGNELTRPFQIGPEPWVGTIRKALNFYYCERCNFEVSGLHDQCHKNLFGVHAGVKKVINGGWHDAADFSQGCNQTGLSLYAMLELLGQLRGRRCHLDLQAQLIEESLWGLDWFLCARFGGGYRIQFQTARIYTSNTLGDLDEIVHPAKNIPWLNLLAAAVEAFAAITLKQTHPEIATACQQAAAEDWLAAVDSAPQELLAASWGAVAGVQLSRLTGHPAYAERAAQFGKVILACQERGFPEGMPFTGFFYTALDHTSPFTFNHLAFDESPLLALSLLCQALPDHPDWIEWYGAALIHVETFKKPSATYTAPYHLLANGLHRRSAVEADPYQLHQVLEGEKLSEEWYLRRFPVWTNELFHGSTGVQLSQTLALTLVSQLRGDLAGQELAERQLQWVFGGNPFAQSLMYGEGYDYGTLYAHRQMDMVGALPVGMDCRSGDQPYWPASNYATTKEIWVVPVSRFLWNVAHLGFPAWVRGRTPGGEALVFTHRATGERLAIQAGEGGAFEINLPSGNYTVINENRDAHWGLTASAGACYDLEFDSARWVDFSLVARPQGEQTIEVAIILQGCGAHTLGLRVCNGSVEDPFATIVLNEGQPIHHVWRVTRRDAESPWAVVVRVDNQWQREAFGK